MKNIFLVATLFALDIILKCHQHTVTAVKILELDIPDLVESGIAYTELDCDYDYDEKEKMQLDIKWYFNEDPTPFYQWVPGQMDRPQIIGETFKDHLDLTYTIQGDDYKKYRALLIKNPTVQLSGFYTCKVSTFLSEDIKQKKMTVYSPASSVTFEQERAINGHQVNITCEATGIFPQPQIVLTWGSYQFDDSNALVTQSEEGNYDIIVHRLVDHSDIPPKTVFGCVLTIPGIDYEVREESIYHHVDGRGYSNPEQRVSSAVDSKKTEGLVSVFVTTVLLLVSS